MRLTMQERSAWQTKSGPGHLDLTPGDLFSLVRLKTLRIRLESDEEWGFETNGRLEAYTLRAQRRHSDTNEGR
jgi:hypothetical protein